MKTGTRTARLIIGLLFCLCAVRGLSAVPSTALAAPGDAEAGKSIYERHCVSCHGADGRGGNMARMLPVTPRNLADRSYMQTRSADQLFAIVKQGGAAQGLSNAMPGFAQQLTDDQIHATVAYLRTLSATSGAASPPSAAAPAAAPASAALRIARMRLSIWPEYDDPRVLILIRGEAAPASAFPTTITLPVPKHAELIGAGMISEQNTLLNHPYQLVPGDAHDTLELNLPVPRFFVEWYHDPYTTTDRKSEKQFAYALRLLYPIDQLAVDIQQPYEATDFRTDPPAEQQSTGAQGGVFHQFSYSDLQPGQDVAFTATYVKTTDRPSVQKQQENAGVSPPSTVWGNPTTLAFAILAGVTVIYASGAVLWRNYRQRLETAAAIAPLPSVAATPVAAAPHTANFCSSCGRKLQPNDAFCAGCGRSLQNG
ncbi:MAG TPA: c-type cytochrome [Candidatus Entotheonella sp.]